MPVPLDIRKTAERIVRDHDDLCVGAVLDQAAYCSTLRDHYPLCTSCGKLAAAIAYAIAEERTHCG